MLFLRLQDATQLVQDSAAVLPDNSPSSAQNILDVIGLAGGFQWPILGVFVLGLALLAQIIVGTYRDHVSATTLRKLDIERVSTRDLRSAATLEGHSTYHLLLRGVLRRFQLDTEHSSLVRAVSGILKAKEESLGITRRVVAYCSSAAGGLGLAGTLVGIYVSFASAGTDPNTVFVGISLAVVSTLLGIAASLMLEAADTFVMRFTSRHLADSRAWGEGVAERLISLHLASGRKRNKRDQTGKS
ncbi:MAG: hypothetical protein F4X05_12045 [Rhodothermaceae bacterium]|nr:hypothetical protein [Rhodothermaceae bacterium]